MLEHLRQRAVETLASTDTVTLSTFGPADIQAGMFPCEAVDVHLYLRVPRTSDHLLNIENNPEAVVTALAWHLRGRARIIPREKLMRELKLLDAPGVEWEEIICIEPERLQISSSGETGYQETIEFDAADCEFASANGA